MCLFGKLLKMGKVAFTGMERLLRGRDGKWRTALSWGPPSRPSNVMRSPSELLRCVASLDPACVAAATAMAERDGAIRVRWALSVFERTFEEC